LVKIMRCFLAKRNSERSAAMVVRRGQPRIGSNAAVTSAVVISPRRLRVVAQLCSSGLRAP
jgi:hypothetical protein